MTSKISFNSLLKSNIKQHLWLPSLISIGMFFAVLLPIWMDGGSDSTLTYNYLLPVGAIIFSFITPFIVFQYINKKSQVDFYHSIPVTRFQLFWVNFISGLLQLLIPFTLIYGIACISTGDMDSDLLYIFINIITMTCTIYAFSTLAIMIAGNLVTTFLLAFVLNFGVLAIAYFTTFLIDILLCTFSKASFPFDFYELATHTTPMMMVFDFNDNPTITSLICLLILAVIAIVLAFVLYLTRSLENATQAVAIKRLRPFIKYLCIYIGSITLGGLFIGITGDFIWLIIGVIIGTIVLNGILEVIFESDFKACFKNVKYNFIFMTLLLAGLFTLYFDAIGYDHRIPEIDDVAGIIIDSYHYELDITQPVLIQSSENKEALLTIIHNTVDQLYDNKKCNTSYGHPLEVTYLLANGSEFTRKYPIDKLPDFTLIDPLQSILKTKEVVFSMNKYDQLDSFKSDKYEEFSIETGINTYTSSSSYYVQIQNEAERQLYEILLDKVAADSKKLDETCLQYYDPTISLKLYDEQNNRTEIYIYPSFYDTIEFLETYYSSAMSSTKNVTDEPMVEEYTYLD